MDPACPELKEAEAGLFKPMMEVEDWDAVDTAIRTHVAVCQRCQKYAEEHASKLVSESKISMTLYHFVAKEAVKDLKKSRLPIPTEQLSVELSGISFLKVLEQWGIVKFDENMLEVREQWAHQQWEKEGESGDDNA